ncbi:MAG: right-handed parallel beta-helix repeat-containing protein, partial [Clostridia bacterium]|nr:right-handed parallel beta-helix repeat-containing protein [Clostridia bacterium]
MKIKKAISLVMAGIDSVLSGFSMTASAQAAKQLYVATDGSDSNSGSISAPFATLEAARDAARAIDGEVIINIRGGVYPVSSTLELTKADSNTTYRAYKDEKVILNGANVLKSSDFQPISEEAKALIVDQTGADKIKMIDLIAHGITEYGSLKCIGMGGTYRDTGYPVALYYDDQMMTIARYPNDEYVETGLVLEVGEQGTEKGFTIKTDSETASRMEKWIASKDLWVFGYFMHDWAEAHLPITIDASKGIITSQWASNYGVVEERRYYVYNLLEELDAPGEWYLDRDTGILYLYPTTDMKEDTAIEFVTFDKPFISVSGAENITIKNLNLQKGIGTGIEAVDVTGFVVDGCELSSVSDTGIIITQSDDNKATTFNSGAKNCYIHDMGAGGIIIYAG